MSQANHQDVNCESIMVTEFAVLTAEMTLKDCVAALLRERVLAMPVVDADGRYLGQFRKNLLISALLPQVAVQDSRFERIARMIDAGLLQDTMAEVRSQFSEISDKPVCEFLDRDAPVLRPEQPLLTAMFYLYQGRNFLPVVESRNSRLVGVISAWDVLENITQSP